MTAASAKVPASPSVNETLVFALTLRSNVLCARGFMS
jgi:hypothetical protein